MNYAKKKEIKINKNIKRYNRVKVLTDILVAVLCIISLGYDIYYCIWYCMFKPAVFPFIDIRVAQALPLGTFPILVLIYCYQKIWDERLDYILKKKRMRKGKA